MESRPQQLVPPLLLCLLLLMLLLTPPSSGAYNTSVLQVRWGIGLWVTAGSHLERELAWQNC